MGSQKLDGPPEMSGFRWFQGLALQGVVALAFLATSSEVGAQGSISPHGVRG